MLGDNTNYIHTDIKTIVAFLTELPTQVRFEDLFHANEEMTPEDLGVRVSLFDRKICDTDFGSEHIYYQTDDDEKDSLGFLSIDGEMPNEQNVQELLNDKQFASCERPDYQLVQLFINNTRAIKEIVKICKGVYDHE